MTNLAQNNGTNNTEAQNITTITERIESNKEIKKSISKLSYYSVEQFIKDAQSYVKAITERRMICIIKKVSSSGMSRNIKFYSCESSNYENNQSYYRNYMQFFIALGFSEVKDTDTFRIGGCGMDMIFHTNYTIIHRLHRFGFISKQDCDNLAQQTPVVL